MTEVSVVRNEEHQRYEAWVDGRAVGRAYYRIRSGAVVFTHTEVEPEYEGHGVGSELARGALDDARRRGDRVVPECPFIAEYIERHEAYADLVATAH
jgi:uncharacterized protein